MNLALLSLTRCLLPVACSLLLTQPLLLGVNRPTGLPYSEACERNKDHILPHLLSNLAGAYMVLEIGSGTGQHAEHFSRALPHLTWVTSDLDEYLPGIAARLKAGETETIHGPLALNVSDKTWPIDVVDAIFTANSLHIMSWEHVQDFFHGAGHTLAEEGIVIVYGPFKYGGKFTTPSNANFDQWLKRRDPLSGVRDFEAVNRLAGKEGLELMADHPMPANNQLLVWKRA